MATYEARIEYTEPRISVPHKGEGYTLFTVAEAEELHASLGKAIRTIKHESLRMNVTWADDAMHRALGRLEQLRNDTTTVPLRTGEQCIEVAIDALRAVLEGPDAD